MYKHAVTYKYFCNKYSILDTLNFRRHVLIMDS